LARSVGWIGWAAPITARYSSSDRPMGMESSPRQARFTMTPTTARLQGPAPYFSTASAPTWSRVTSRAARI
jgi:hypothetical protein